MGRPGGDELAAILRWEQYGDPRELWRERLGVPAPRPGDTEEIRAERRQVLMDALGWGL